MSIEIRHRTEGDRHWDECDWGIFDNSEADPTRGLQHLMIVTGDCVRQLLESGPRPGPRGGTHSATVDGQRIFAHCDYNGHRTTWELFEAHFADGLGPDNLMVGRWPD